MVLSRVLLLWKFDRTTLSRGSKSRNKVSVGEPAEGSLSSKIHLHSHPYIHGLRKYTQRVCDAAMIFFFTVPV